MARKPFKPDKQKWEDIAISVGLTVQEADQSFNNFGANGWKRANGIVIETWEQVPYLLNYWRNHRQEFARSPQKLKLYPIKGKVCSKNKCRMPAVYKDSTGSYDSYLCEEHMPNKVKEKYK